MNSVTRLTLILLLVILALPSLAQEQPPRWGLQFNYLVPLNEFPLAHRIKFSYSAKVLLRFDISNKFMGQFGGGYGEYAGNDFDGAYYKTILVPMEFKLMYLLSDSKTVKPYVFGGIGGMPYHVKTIPHFIGGLYEEGFAGYAEGGLGVQFDLVGPIVLDLSAGAGITTIDNLNYYVNGAAKDGYCFVGIGLFFGGGFVDSDGDGVPDNMDKCPNTPKGVKVDNFGCPLDSDGDGVPDYLDKCPNTPAGVKVDANGCPIMKEEFKHFKLSGDANFNSGKSDLLPAAYPTLDKLADAMVNNPNYKWSVEGYTDSKGKDASNLKLSEKRAQAIVDYLVSKGVNKDVFTTKGFGKANPVADNKTEEGRAKNRRIEIKIIN